MTNLRARLAEVLVNPERIDILDVADFVIENADELARALEDAERYRFCKTIEGQVIAIEVFRKDGGEFLDTAIDAARNRHE